MSTETRRDGKMAMRDETGGVQYQVIFHDHVLQVPESALEAVHVYDDEEKEHA